MIKSPITSRPLPMPATAPCDCCERPVEIGEAHQMSSGLPGKVETYWICDDCHRTQAEATAQAMADLAAEGGVL